MNVYDPIDQPSINVSIIDEAEPISVDNRRQYIARIPVEIDLHITTAEKKGIARSIDVSVTGMLVQTLLELQ